MSRQFMSRQFVKRQFIVCLRIVRHLSGDDAYERYLVHQRHHHANQPVLDRRAFYLAEQQRKWSGVQRCC